MTENQKAEAYGELLNEHTRIGNKVNEIKGQDIELSKDQLRQIDVLQNRQVQIMDEIKKLFS